jgi:hypothetical protein
MKIAVLQIVAGSYSEVSTKVKVNIMAYLLVLNLTTRVLGICPLQNFEDKIPDRKET